MESRSGLDSALVNREIACAALGPGQSEEVRLTLAPKCVAQILVTRGR